MRAQLRRVILESTGQEAAQAFYEGSILRSILWSKLVDAAINADAARRMLHARTKIEVKVGTNGAIELDLSAIDPRDYAGTSAAQLAAELQQELECVIPAVIDLKSIETQVESLNVIQGGRVSSALRRIKNTPRQEERIALLLDEILRDPTIGSSVLLQYAQDRAKFATHALSKIREMIPIANIGGGGDEQAIATLVPAFFAYTYPMNRGRLLYFLAKHLAKYPLINEAIDNSLRRTASMFVDEHRHAISELLQSARRRSLKENLDLTGKGRR
jgi:hypothetical protein